MKLKTKQRTRYIGHLFLDTIVPGKAQCGKTGATVLSIYYYAGEIFEYKCRMC